MPSYRSSRGPMPDQVTIDAFVSHVRTLPHPPPQVGHIRHDRQLPGAVYIGRRNGGLPQSPFHNPFIIPQDGDRARVIERFEAHARLMLLAAPDWLLPLRDAKYLLCWCRRIDQERPACHGDVLVRLLGERYVDGS